MDNNNLDEIYKRTRDGNPLAAAFFVCLAILILAAAFVAVVFH